jgi:DNA-binding transcriptional ArsR family regulator
MTMAKKKCCSDGELNLPDEVDEALRSCGGLDVLRRALSSEDVRLNEAVRHEALSDPKRLMILESLQYCDLCPCILREVTGLSDSKLSYHLKLLEEASLVSWRQSRNWRIYSLTPSGRIPLLILRSSNK